MNAFPRHLQSSARGRKVYNPGHCQQIGLNSPRPTSALSKCKYIFEMLWTRNRSRDDQRDDFVASAVSHNPIIPATIRPLDPTISGHEFPETGKNWWFSQGNKTLETRTANICLCCCSFSFDLSYFKFQVNESNLSRGGGIWSALELVKMIDTQFSTFHELQTGCQIPDFVWSENRR